MLLADDSGSDETQWFSRDQHWYNIDFNIQAHNASLKCPKASIPLGLFIAIFEI